MNLLTKLSLFTFSTLLTIFQVSFGYLSSHLLFIFMTYFYLVTEVKCRCLIICWSEYKYWLCGHNPNDDCRVLKRPGGCPPIRGRCWWLRTNPRSAIIMSGAQRPGLGLGRLNCPDKEPGSGCCFSADSFLMFLNKIWTCPQY